MRLSERALESYTENWSGGARSVHSARTGSFVGLVADFGHGDSCYVGDGRVGMIAGRAWDEGDQPVNGSDIAWGDDAFLYGLNGAYAVVSYDEATRTLRVLADRVGNQRVYYWDTPEVLVVASGFSALTSLPEFDKTIDERGLADFLCFGCCLEDRTLLRSVRYLEARQELVWRDGVLSVKKYWDFTFEGVDADRSVEEYAREYQELLGRAAALRAADHTVIPITGGMDARLVACEASLGISAEKVSTFTLGDPHRYDVQFGKKIVDLLGYTHTAIPITSTFFQDKIDDAIERTEGAIIGHTCWRTAADDFLAERKGATLLAGYWGEFMRVYQDDDNMESGSELESIYQWHKRENVEWFWMKEELLGELVQPNVFAHIDGHIDETLRRLFFDAPADHPRHKSEYMCAANWWPRRYGRMMTDHWSTYCDVDFPLNDMKAVEFGTRVPLEVRRHGKVNRWIFQNHFPRVAAVPYSRTAMPYDAGPLTNAYYRAKNVARYKVLPKLTGGRLGTENLGAYVHYRQWLREHNRAFVSDLLKDTEVYSDVLSPETVLRMLDDVLSGRSDDYGKIYNLATFILWRKKYAI